MKNYGKRYTKEFKEEAVRLLLTSGKPTDRLARELGVSGVRVVLATALPAEWSKHFCAILPTGPLE